MTALLRELPAGDPRKGFWTYEDLAVVFGTSKVKYRMREWEAQGFPAPLPWRSRQHRWNPAAVLGWKARQELRHRARELNMVGG